MNTENLQKYKELSKQDQDAILARVSRCQIILTQILPLIAIGDTILTPERLMEASAQLQQAIDITNQ